MAVITRLDNFKAVVSQNESLKELYHFLDSCLHGAYKKQYFKENTCIHLHDDIFVILQTYSLKSRKNAFFETHQKYVDFQLTIYGNESFLIGDSKDFKILKPYNEEKDLIVYKPQANCHRILSYPSTLCIFFPQDVHAGGLTHKTFKDNKVFKLVAKVPVKLLNFMF